VGSFTVDTNHKDSPTGNAILSNLYTTIKGSWILDSEQLTMFALACLVSRHIKASNLFSLVYQTGTVFTPVILELFLLAIDFI